MKGVLLAGGSGSRLNPLTLVTNKHLLPVWKRPMIYYPLRNLVAAGIRKIFVVTGGSHFSSIGQLLGSGEKEELERLGIEETVAFSYGVQKRPGGIAHALGLAKEFCGRDPVTVILGDNIYQDLEMLKDAVTNFDGGGHIFLKEIPDERLYQDIKGGRRAKYGMAVLEGDRVTDIEEKPEKPRSNLAVTGSYIYDNDVFEIIGELKPSWRGELEITDVNNAYIRSGKMKFSTVGGEWTDAGSLETLLRANVRAAEWNGDGSICR